VVRSRAGLKVESHPALEVMEGDLADPEFVSTCLAGKEGVFSCLGYVNQGKAPWTHPANPGFLTPVADNVVQAMKKHGVHKLVAISAAGVGDSREFIPWWYSLFITMSFLRNIMPLLEEAEAVFLGAEDLDVTLARPPILTEGPLTKKAFAAESNLPHAAFISKEDLAFWMMEEMYKEDKFASKTPFVVCPKE
jgi:hypothetical protein